MNSTFNSRPNMSEQEILSDLLSSEKQLVKEYASDISESSCANLRGLLANNLVECSADQLAIFEQMNQRGFYKTKQAPQSASQPPSRIWIRSGSRPVSEIRISAALRGKRYPPSHYRHGGYFNSFHMRFHLAPPGISVISMPCALSSSRMRSASAKFFAFFAS